MIKKISTALMPEYFDQPNLQHLKIPYPCPIIKRENPKDPMIRVIIVDRPRHFG